MAGFKKIHWFLWLLPLFFVLHGVKENFGFIDMGSASLLLLNYWIYAAVAWILFYLIFKNALSSSWMSAALLAYYLFFGAVKEFFIANSSISFLGKYSVMLSVGILGLSMLCYFLYKYPAKRSKFFSYINTLFAILILAEGIQIVALGREDSKGLSIYFTQKGMDIKSSCAPTTKPNIYFLLFDEYESSISLQQRFQFINPLDSTLKAEQFHVLKDARSNYNFTPFSIASLLNMDYLQGIQNPQSVTVEDYAKCNTLIKNNRLLHFLHTKGYQLLNYSIFDLAGHPTEVEQQLLPLQSKLISDRTLYAHVKKDIGWKLMEYFPFNYLFRMDYMQHHHNNQLFFQKVIDASTHAQTHPFFLYAHFYMPHPPFYVNENGELRNSIQDERQGNAADYLAYALYTNKKIMQMVQSIKKNDPKGIILLMGDHGYRNQKEEKTHLFNALNALYFPDQQYASFYSNVSHVNQFRLVLNKIFCTNLPLLKDRQILLKDKGELP